VAEELGVEVVDVPDVNFSSFTIPAYGVEPSLIAYSVCYEANKISEPIKGLNAVYLMKVISSSTVEMSDYASEQIRLTNGLSSRVDYQVFEALKESSEIVDNRAKYF